MSVSKAIKSSKKVFTMSLLEMFCDVDSFCVSLPKQLESHQIGKGKRGPQAGLCLSEIMTIMIHFHQSHYRDFKAYYCDDVCKRLCGEFPGLVSYTRFVELMPGAVGPMLLYLLSRLGQTRGVAFIDSTPRSFSRKARIAWLRACVSGPLSSTNCRRIR